MYTKFIFDGIESTHFGLVCGSMDTKSGASNVAFNTVSLNSEKSGMGDNWFIYGSDYKNPISFELNLFNSDFSEMTKSKVRDILNWLCKDNEYAWFQMYTGGEDNDWFNVVMYNPEYITVGKRIVGLKLTCACETPYGYSDEIVKTIEITDTNKSFVLYNNSDVNAFIYPDVSITMPTTISYDTLNIENSSDQDHRTVTLSNLFGAETIHMDNKHKKFSTTRPNKVCMRYFNKHWFRINKGQNVYVVDNNCTIEITYREARKVGLIV